MVEKFRTGDCIGNHVGNITDTNHIEGNWNRKEVVSRENKSDAYLHNPISDSSRNLTKSMQLMK